jgi:hypothetical protein
MMRRVLLLLGAAAAAFAQAPDCSLLAGWAQHGEARSYTGDNLFEYMDGNAEGYLLYHFVQMRGVSCQAGDDTLVIDVSEMENAEWAYGMFASNRDPRAPVEKIGTEAQIVPRRAILVKDKYFVEIASSREQPDVLRQFVQAMAKRIAGTSEPPEALTWFPAEKLVAGSVRMVPESVLGIGALKRGYVAEYDFGKAFLVKETSPESAAEVMNKLRARIGGAVPVKIADEGFEATDKYLGRLCIFRKGRTIGGFTGLAAGADAVATAGRLAERVK